PFAGAERTSCRLRDLSSSRGLRSRRRQELRSVRGVVEAGAARRGGQRGLSAVGAGRTVQGAAGRGGSLGRAESWQVGEGAASRGGRPPRRQTRRDAGSAAAAEPPREVRRVGRATGG